MRRKIRWRCGAEPGCVSRAKAIRVETLEVLHQEGSIICVNMVRTSCQTSLRDPRTGSGGVSSRKEHTRSPPPSGAEALVWG